MPDRTINTVSTDLSGRSFQIETGYLANQANGSVMVKYADTTVLTAATQGEEKDLPFLPLTVEYREKQSASGKIPGGFFKREGKPSTKETTTARLVDRPIRPLFPDGTSNDIQVVTNVYSADRENDPDILAINGASAALLISDIPWNGPIGATRIGVMDKNLVVNPTESELELSTLNMVVVSKGSGVVMVEGHGEEVDEEIVINGIELAHEKNQELLELQKELNEIAGKPDLEFESPEASPELEEQVRSIALPKLQKAVNTADKQERSDLIDAAKDEVKESLIPETVEDPDDIPDEGLIDDLFYELEHEVIRDKIKSGSRINDRDHNQVRDILCETNVLERTHGSAIFTRGETQAMVTVTLGTSVDEQVVDGLTEEFRKKFMLHYNFPPFCVGETRPMHGPGRREIGHGQLAEHAVRPVLPETADFPYTIRTDSDILESNGSSSMATVSGGSLALMDAGVELERHVTGVAMGLVKDGDNYHILTDILGDEDHAGDMDLKVAGTKRGVTAIQMDIKIDQIPTHILEKAFDRAREGRLHILEKMNQEISEPREEISEHAPRLYHVDIDPDKIGRIIGPGGKTIRDIEEQSGANVEIDDDGEVTISAVDKEAAETALERVQNLVYEPSEGEIITGKVTGVKDFGAFVEVTPGGEEGLVHVSELADDYVETVDDYVNEGDTLTVKVLEIDEDRISLSRRAALEEEEEETDSSKPSRADGHNK